MTKLPTGRHTQQIKSSKKDEERYMTNKSWRSKTKTYIKKVNETLESGKPEEVKAILSETIKYIDQAASKGAIHKNKASRLKSRLVKKINQPKTEK